MRGYRRGKNSMNMLQKLSSGSSKAFLFAILIPILALSVPQEAKATVTIGNCTIVTTTIAGSTRVTGTTGTNCTYADFSNYISSACLTNPSSSTCSAQELDAVQQINLACTYGTSSACPSDITPDQKDALEKATPPGACPVTNWNFSTCIWEPLMSWLGSWFLTLGGSLLKLSGALFDVLIQYVIIGFSTTLNTLNIMPAITVGWTVFRDFANILIIGIFAFIAISIILGLKEFGQKKLIARVLIIAVLINFSMLFAKIIIDASNFTAQAIYQQMAGGPTAANPAPFDISQAFLSPMHISSVWNDSKVLTDNVAKSTKSGVQAFMFGLVGGLVLLAAALVLFYGCFLIAARAVLLIFLMLTASIAFATFLVPNFQKSSYGWDKWWSSLINASLFAPLLMILLSISLGVITAAGKVVTAPLGNIIGDPQKALSGTAWVSILVYIIGIGTLFVSFKLASSFAGKIAGLSLASSTLALPFTLGSQFVAGPLGRGLVGRFSARRSLQLDDKIDDAKFEARRTGNYKPLEKLMRTKQKTDARAAGSYNIMNTGGAKALAEGLGIQKFALGADKKPPSFADSAKAKAEHAAKEAAGLALSSDEKEKVREEAHNAEVARRKEHKESLNESKKAYEEQLETIKTRLQPQAVPLESELDREKSVRSAVEKQHERTEQTIAKEIAQAAAGSPERADAEQRFTQARAAKNSALQEQDNKIQTIDQQIKTVKAPITELESKIKALDNQINRDFDDKSINKEAAAVAKTAVGNAERVARDIAMKTGASLANNTLTSMVQSALGIDPTKTVAGKMAFKQTKKKIRVKEKLDLHKAEAEELKSAEPDEEKAGGEEKSGH